jgi:hypothetical protein
MNAKGTSVAETHGQGRAIAVAAVCLGLVLACLFLRSFNPAEVIFANDGPLGVLMSQALSVPEAFTGYWMDLYWLGASGGTASISLTYVLLWLLGPVGFAKLYAPLTLLLLGLSAWIFFRTLKLRPGLCTAGALAAALNMNYFSNTCWGLGTRSLTLACVFLALAALNARRFGCRWLNAVLAGFAVGMGVIEGADNGAIFSLYVAAFVLFQSWAAETSLGARLRASARVVLVGAFAALIASQVLVSLVGLGIKNVAGMQQSTESKEEHWGWATQWSLPKIETLRVIIPGLYGYRMDTPNGGQYWGRVGEQPGWTPGSPGFARYSGSGEYAGVLVVLFAAWTLAQSFRRGGGVFGDSERRMIWFWAGAGLVSLLLAWGRFAPFYRIIYALPYFSTIRNPIKFMHPCHLALMILFGYGLLGMSRIYLQAAAGKALSLPDQLRDWWGRLQGADKRWVYGCLGFVAASVVAWLAYTTDRASLVAHLTKVGFDPTLAQETAVFSSREVGLYVLFVLASVGALFLIQSGGLAGNRARWAPVILGTVLAIDLARASAPWIIYYDYREKYASNPIIDILRDKPYTHRSMLLPLQGGGQWQYLQQLFMVEWLQHHYQFYNIQSLNVAQEPRMAEDKAAYVRAVGANVLRYWQLTNTRFLYGTREATDLLNQQFDPAQRRFRTHTLFELYPIQGTPTVGVRTNTTGPLALIEFVGALPRAKLYPRWQVSTNDTVTLAKLADPTVDPEQIVLVAEDPGPAGSGGAGAEAGTVEWLSYAPKTIVQRTAAKAPAVLLVNDRFDPGWKVWVDGKPAPVLRANFLVRGVYVPAGEHTVKWHFEPKLTGFHVTLGSMIAGVLLCGFLAFYGRRREISTPDS